MKIVGIDLSGPRNFADTCLVSFEERGEKIHLIDVHEGADDNQIIETVSGLGTKERLVIGIDAPLCYNSKGGDRPSDAELRRIVHQHGGRVGIMPPTMIRMVYLTLRGVVLTRLLENLKSQYDLGIVEVHPGACMILRGADAADVRLFKTDPFACKQLLDWLDLKGLKEIFHTETVSDHYVAACAAALVTWKWNFGNSVWCFTSRPPDHPYDFPC